MQDARNVGECVNLKVFLQIHERAMEYLIGDLEKRASECKLEKDFSFPKARRLRQAIDEAIQRYHRMTAPIPSIIAPNSARRKTREFIKEFVSALQQFLPCIDTADISEITVGRVDWENRIERCIAIVDDMIGNLKPLHTHMQEVLINKTVISDQIQLSLGQMIDIL